MRFSIRDLLWLMALAAISAAWWVDHVRLRQSQPPALVPASGRVTLQGTPLAAVCLTVIYPDGSSAVGVTNALGEFTLTFNGRIGVPMGTRLPVILTQLQAPPNGGIGHSQPTMTVLSDFYSDAKHPVLSLDIPADGSRHLQIDLK